MTRWSFTVLAAGLLLAAGVHAQYGAPASGEWTSYGGDLGHPYSPLAQITAANFNTLDVAWRLKTEQFGPRPDTSSSRPH